MEKRILVVALLLVPMGIARAYHEGAYHTTPASSRPQYDEKAPASSMPMIRTGQASLGTQTGTVRQQTGEVMLGTQAGTVSTGSYEAPAYTPVK